MNIGEVFISHTHADAEIANALSDAIEGVFGSLLTTSYSTKKELDGGIKPGEEWFRWIVERVRVANIAVILLTPASTRRPWVLWEAGAVYGAGIASAEASARKVRPLLFKLADVLGQTLLRLGRMEEAQSVYRRAGEIIERLAEENIWTFATLATASLVLKDEPSALRHLERIAALKPNPDDLRRIEKGLEDVQKWLVLETEAFERWRSRLRGKP